MTNILNWISANKPNIALALTGIIGILATTGVHLPAEITIVLAGLGLLLVPGSQKAQARRVALRKASRK